MSFVAPTLKQETLIEPDAEEPEKLPLALARISAHMLSCICQRGNFNSAIPGPDGQRRLAVCCHSGFLAVYFSFPLQSAPTTNSDVGKDGARINSLDDYRRWAQSAAKK